jgi:Ca2+-binding RTX toxin-like protein
MLQVHDKNKFNDDGDLRRKYELDERGEARAGVMIAIGIAFATTVSFVKNVLQASAQQQGAASDQAADEASGCKVDEAPAESLDYQVAAPEAADDPVEPAAAQSGQVIRHPGSRTLDAGASQGPPASPRDAELLSFPKFAALALPLESSAASTNSRAIDNGAAFVTTESQLTFTPQGKAYLEQPSERTQVNRRPNSLDSVWLGTIFLGAHLAIEVKTLLGKSVDPDGDKLTVENLTVSSGLLTTNADGSWHYLPVYDDPRPVVFRYQVSDGQLDAWQFAVLKFDTPPSVPLNGTSEADDLTGSVRVDAISAGDGDDLIIAREGADVILGGNGADRILGDDADDVVWAGAGNDFVLGGNGNDALYGEEGDDILHGENGDDVLVGGEGNDHLFGDDGNDLLVGGSGADTIIDGAGDDIAYAGDNNDIIVASAGNDVIDGGAGLDTYDASAATQAVFVDLGRGTIDGPDNGHDRIVSIERFITGSGNDTITGGAAAEIVFTGEWNDEVNAGLGAVVVDLGAGDDLLNARIDQSVESFDGGDGNDTLKVRVSADGVTINLEGELLTFADGHSAEILCFENIATNGDGSVFVVGNGQSNVIVTGDGNDTVSAGDGADNVATGGGNDVIRIVLDGESDWFDGEGGVDLIDLSTEAQDLSVNLETGEIMSGLEVDHLRNIEAVRAGSGNDRIIAGEGRNEIWGGDGHDLFVFVTSKAAGNGRHDRDRIHDFEVGDRIDIDKLVDEFHHGGHPSRELRFTLLEGENTTFTHPGELRLSAYQEFEGGASILILEGNLDPDAETELQIEIAGDTDAIQKFLTSNFGRGAADQF